MWHHLKILSGVGGGGEVHCEWQGGGCRQGGRASNTPCKVSKMTTMVVVVMGKEVVPQTHLARFLLIISQCIMRLSNLSPI